jgi:tetratricopeptide (TPR) repeat protein
MMHMSTAVLALSRFASPIAAAAFALLIVRPSFSTAQSTSPSNDLSLTDGRTTVALARPAGLTEPPQSGPTHRVLKGNESFTQLTLLPSDQPTDPGAAAAFVENTKKAMTEAKGNDLLDVPTAQNDPKFALVMHYRVKTTPQQATDTTLRWRRVGPLVVQAITEVTSQDSATVQAANDAMASMLEHATIPGYTEATEQPTTSNNAANALNNSAPVNSAPVRERFASGTLEFTPPAGFEQIARSHGDASVDYLSPDHSTEMVLLAMPPGTPMDSSSGPIQLNNAKRELAAAADKPAKPPELMKDTTLPVEIRWSFTRDGKPATGFRLFRKIGKLQVARCEVTTTADADKARALGEQTLNEMTSLIPDEPPPTASASSKGGNSAHASAASGDAQSKMNQRAQAALDQAKKLQADKKDDDAYARFKFVVSEYPNSSSAGEAKTAIEAYEADPAFAERHKKPAELSPADKATAALALADNYATAGKNDEAMIKYQQIIKDYPGTPSAEKAKKRLADMLAPKPKKP